MVAVVNGYVCFTTCDAKAAKQGKDPLAKPGEQQDEESKKKNGLDGQPATILDGALKNLADAIDPTKSGDAGNSTSGNSPPGDRSSSSSRVDVVA
jgi:hypothetical protein